MDSISRREWLIRRDPVIRVHLSRPTGDWTQDQMVLTSGGFPRSDWGYDTRINHPGSSGDRLAQEERHLPRPQSFPSLVSDDSVDLFPTLVIDEDAVSPRSPTSEDPSPAEAAPCPHPLQLQTNPLDLRLQPHLREVSLDLTFGAPAHTQQQAPQDSPATPLPSISPGPVLHSFSPRSTSTPLPHVPIPAQQNQPQDPPAEELPDDYITPSRHQRNSKFSYTPEQDKALIEEYRRDSYCSASRGRALDLKLGLPPMASKSWFVNCSKRIARRCKKLKTCSTPTSTTRSCIPAAASQVPTLTPLQFPPVPHHATQPLKIKIPSPPFPDFWLPHYGSRRQGLLAIADTLSHTIPATQDHNTYCGSGYPSLTRSGSGYPDPSYQDYFGDDSLAMAAMRPDSAAIRLSTLNDSRPVFPCMMNNY